jgi:hypothetical protein
VSSEPDHSRLLGASVRGFAEEDGFDVLAHIKPPPADLAGRVGAGFRLSESR